MRSVVIHHTVDLASFSRLNGWGGAGGHKLLDEVGVLQLEASFTMAAQACTGERRPSRGNAQLVDLEHRRKTRPVKKRTAGGERVGGGR